MSVLTTYYLQPPKDRAALLQPPEDRAALSFHFGRQGIGMEEASETLASDSLFAALVAQAVLLDPRNLGSDGGPAFAQPFVSGTPPFALSSLFPRLGDLILLPRPALELKMVDHLRSEIGKGFKKLRYLSPKLFSAICTGRQIASKPIIMQKGKVWLSQEEAEKLPNPWGKQPKEDKEPWFARLRETPIWEIESLPHVAVDRVSNASAYFEVGRVTYAPGSGLALLVRFAEPTGQAQFERLLDLLGESGLGGRRSSGAGAFHGVRGTTPDLNLGTPGSRQVLLSRYLPRPDEREALRSKQASYQLVNVGGWLYSTGKPAQRRQRVRMVAEGSVLDGAKVDGPIRGTVVDVRPVYTAEKPHPQLRSGNGTAHPVYRSGLALALPIPDNKEGT